MKIKKDTRPQLTRLPRIILRYRLMVPAVGLLDALTMAGFFMNPVTEGRWGLKIFYFVCGLIGVGFVLWGFLWRAAVDGKWIVVRPVVGKAKDVPFTDLKKAVIRKKKRNGSFVYYQLIDRHDGEIVKIYPVMSESAELLERLKRLGIPIEEVSDR